MLHFVKPFRELPANSRSSNRSAAPLGRQWQSPGPGWAARLTNDPYIRGISSPRLLRLFGFAYSLWLQPVASPHWLNRSGGVSRFTTHGATLLLLLKASSVLR